MPGARSIRLVAKAAPKRFGGQLDEMAFVHQDGDVAPPGDSVPSPSSLLVLRRNEPVRITIVNRTRAATGVHWHGIEVPAAAFKSQRRASAATKSAVARRRCGPRIPTPAEIAEKERLR